MLENDVVVRTDGCPFTAEQTTGSARAVSMGNELPTLYVADLYVEVFDAPFEGFSV